MGCGPAGMLAAHACVLFGIVPDIYSIPNKSVMPGAIYLHHRIPYIDSDEVTLSYVKLGSSGGYAEKVYGSPHAPTSWEKFPEGNVHAYSLRDAYQKLWDKYNRLITGHNFEDDENIEHRLQNYDIVMCTIPAPAVCRLPVLHNFDSQEISILEGAPPDTEIPPNTIVYNGTSDWWYRSSNIFGYIYTEATGVNSQMKGIKPLQTDCNCYPRFHRLGRFGQWKKGVLSHDAFFDAARIMKQNGLDSSALL